MVMDACSVILLAKASVLEAVADQHSVCVTKSVYDEVLQGKQKKYEDALLLERLRDAQKIKIVTADEAFVCKLMNDFNMEEGEASTIAFGLANKAIVATDNRQGRKAARVNGLQLVGSIELIVHLVQLKRINKAKGKAALETLRKNGWFDNSLIERALEDVQ